jgi:stage II sporulation protein E
MVKRLRTGGALSASDVPDFFRMRCRSIDTIIAKINLGAANLLENTVKRDKTELFALDYQAISRLLHESTKGREIENSPDPALSKRFADLLADMHIGCTGVYAYGTRKKTLVASGISAGTIEYSTRELRHTVSKSLDIKVTEPKFEFSGSVTTLSFESLPCLGIRSHIRSRKKEGESISGDVCSVFTGRDSRAYALISDGMGSGRDAAVAAKICAVFLEKMLSAGCTKDVTLRLLSNFIRARGEECHSTVDLFEADLHTGTAEFLKSGAVPSYLIREGTVYRMDARTLPLGITKEIDTKALVISVKPGDLLVMVSDGIAGDLAELLASYTSESTDPEYIADKLYELSSEKDDSSIIVLEIVEYIDSF